MSFKQIDEFYWLDIDPQKIGRLSDAEKYKAAVDWSAKARGRNPNMFDALTEWLLDDACWGDDMIAENEQALMLGVIARFKEQNARLRSFLTELAPSGVVNEAVFKALDRFDGELSGRPADERLREAVGKMYADFSVMAERGVRELIAGNKTGPDGVNHVNIFGFVNYLKDCDAAVQWALFMPDTVVRQQRCFKVDSFEYKQLPALRFIGREGEDLADIEVRKNLFRVLDGMNEHKSGYDYDVLFMHHYGLTVDVGEWHGFWGRFMKAGTPVPDGFAHFDFIPKRDANDFTAEVPVEKVEAVDTTAAGDVFNGALAVALSENREITDAVRFACKAASISVTRIGAQASAPYRKELNYFKPNL